MKYMMVLNDLETFTDLDGCVIVQVQVPDTWDETDITDSEKHKLMLDAGSQPTWDETLHDDCKVVAVFNHELPDMTPSIALDNSADIMVVVTNVQA